jgi:hypothetical protein
VGAAGATRTPAARLGELRFLYVGAGDTEAAIDYYTTALGARVRWRFRRFGADVAAVELGTGPLVLLADHRPPGTVLPIWTVDHLGAAIAAARAGGVGVDGPMATPEGDVAVLTTPGGVELALLEVARPDALDGAYADTGNPHRVIDGEP